MIGGSRKREPVCLAHAVGVLYRTTWIASYELRYILEGIVPLEPLGDNSSQTVTPFIFGARKVVLDLGGSGALTGFRFCRYEGDDRVEE